MKLRTTRARALATGLGAVALLAVMQTQASASVGQWTIPVTGGNGKFQPNPSGSIPGDSIQACDTASDGIGIETYLDVNYDGVYDRTATTRGHTAGYCSPWKSGDLPENTQIRMYVARVKGDATISEVYADVVTS